MCYLTWDDDLSLVEGESRGILYYYYTVFKCILYPTKCLKKYLSLPNNDMINPKILCNLKRIFEASTWSRIYMNEWKVQEDGLIWCNDMYRKKDSYDGMTRTGRRAHMNEWHVQEEGLT